MSPDGRMVLTGSLYSSAQLSNAVTGLRIGNLLDHKGPVWAVAVSPDGRTALTAAHRDEVKLWDVRTGQPVGRTFHPGHVFDMAFSPDGKTVVTGNFDKIARLWDAATGRPKGTPMEHKGAVVAVAFSPDGRTILTGSADGRIRLFETPAQLPDDVPRLAAWIQTNTGRELDGQGIVHPLDTAAWRQHRELLGQLEGPSSRDAGRLPHPVLFRLDPSAAAHARGAQDNRRKPTRHPTEASQCTTQ